MRDFATGSGMLNETEILHFSQSASHETVQTLFLMNNPSYRYY